MAAPKTSLKIKGPGTRSAGATSDTEKRLGGLQVGGEHRQRLLLRLLETLNQPLTGRNTIREVINLIRSGLKFEAVGIRLQEGEDYPYYETNGFPDSFVEKERYLCAHDAKGRLIREVDGSNCLECMCGNIISGRTDPSQPFFTGRGSFWTNSTTDLLGSGRQEDLQGATRNECNRAGYESVALLPLKAGNITIGLLQLNDHRRDMFTEDVIEFLESVAASLGIALSRKRAEEALHVLNDRLLAEQEALCGKNVALKEVLDQFEHEKKQIAQQIQSNIDRSIKPLLEKLTIPSDSRQADLIDLIRSSLNEVTSPFVGKLEQCYASLSPRELEVCIMVKSGLSSKEIAASLSTSDGTVRNQRKSIRRKLGLSNNKSNLQTILKTL